MIRAEVVKILGNQVKLKIKDEEKTKLYPYPKGVTPSLDDRVYLSQIGEQYIIVAVHSSQQTI